MPAPSSRSRSGEVRALFTGAGRRRRATVRRAIRQATAPPRCPVSLHAPWRSRLALIPLLLRAQAAAGSRRGIPMLDPCAQSVGPPVDLALVLPALRVAPARWSSPWPRPQSAGRDTDLTKASHHVDVDVSCSMLARTQSTPARQPLDAVSRGQKFRAPPGRSRSAGAVRGASYTQSTLT